MGRLSQAKCGDFARLRAPRSKIVSIPLKEAISKNRVVDDEMIRIASELFEEIGKEAAVK